MLTKHKKVKTLVPLKFKIKHCKHFVLAFSAAAEGATLALFSYDELKEKKKRKKAVNLSVLGDEEK